MRRRLTHILLALAVLCAAAGSSFAEKRAALVIGINAYQEVPALKKAVGDARAVAAVSERLGFAVTVVTDPSRRDLNRSFADFERSLTPGDTALIYYSGHGVEIDGNNYLLPADVPKPASGDRNLIKDEAVSLASVLDRLNATGASTRLIIIDACRDNPFAKAGTKGIGNERGLGRVEAPRGTFIMYSAGYGQTALDRLSDADAEPTSVYTRVLVRHLAIAGKEITDVAKDVRSEVSALAGTTGHEQHPAYYDELTGRFMLAPGDSVPASQPPQQSADPVASDYQLAQQVSTQEAWEAFLAKHGSDRQNFYVQLAEAALKKLAVRTIPDRLPGAEETPDSRNKLVMTLKDECKATIDMRPDLAPKHVEQIKELTKRGFYDGIVFHRVIDGFMAQTGDPTGTGTGGSDLPDIAAEYSQEPFARGTVGMARAQDPNSANSQFFIMFADGPHLNGQHTVWGKIAEGMDCIDKIERGEPPTNPDTIVSLKLQ